MLAAVALMSAACAAQTEGLTEPATRRSEFRFEGGNPPPPPLDTQAVSIDASASTNEGTVFFRPSARYFVNRTETVAWLAFASNSTVLASPNARLQFNEKSGTTHGNGTLTDASGKLLLDLSQVTIIGDKSDLGSCNPENRNVCGSITFVTPTGGAGTLLVRRRSVTDDGPG
jgi:hypothetical protein